ncbi:hypothetical protein MASR2M117_04600 [Paludibacter sp.]
MMKSNFTTYLLSALFSLLFIFAGTGYNIVKYCCNTCASEGIEFIAHHACNEIHQHAHHSCCSSKHNHKFDFEDLHLVNTTQHNNINADGSCEINRIQVDNFSFSENNIIPDAVTSLAFVSAFIAVIYNPSYEVISNGFYNQPPDYSLPDGRDILTNKSVLII